MTDLKRTPQPTLIGLPRETWVSKGLDGRDHPVPQLVVNNGDWKLQPYRDVHVPTPSGARPLRQRGESTPVYIAPARRKADPTVRLSPPSNVPSKIAIAAAAVTVCYVLAILMALTLGW